MTIWSKNHDIWQMFYCITNSSGLIYSTSTSALLRMQYKKCHVIINLYLFNEAFYKHSFNLLTDALSLDVDFLFLVSSSFIPKYSGYKDFMLSSVMGIGFSLYLLQAVFISSTTFGSVSTKWTSRSNDMAVPLNCCIPMMYARAHNSVGTLECPKNGKKWFKS